MCVSFLRSIQSLAQKPETIHAPYARNGFASWARAIRLGLGIGGRCRRADLQGDLCERLGQIGRYAPVVPVPGSICSAPRPYDESSQSKALKTAMVVS